MAMKTSNVNFTFFISISVLLRVSVCDVHRSERFTFKVTQDGRQKLFQGLKTYNFTELFQITPSTFIFEYKGSLEASEVVKKVIEVYRNEIVACETIKVYNDTLKPETVQSIYSYKSPTLTFFEQENQPNLVCSHYYGFNVSEVWSMGITGKGVTIGVTDVGINTNLLDLERNINKSLSMNFLTDSDNVTPEEFPNLRDKAPYFTDHGNRVASVVAATMANEICSAGIAYNASIAALKIFNVTLDKNDLFGLEPEHWTASDVIAKALTHFSDEIDIIVNAWTTTSMFDSLDLTIREAFQCGVNSGRRGHGTVYLVPAGPAGNGLSNSINTITVNSMGRFGTIPDNVIIDASVITSGLEKGNNLSAATMVTTSHHDGCITSFKGVSAATAQVGGIIALGLEANPSLTKRDVEHLLVHASDHRGLKETRFFSRNGAGIHFHGIFGFGLLNALKFVTLAQGHKQVPEQVSRKLLHINSSMHLHHIQMFEFCYSCDVLSDPSCLTTIEHVEVTILFKTKTSYLRMELVSPHHTRSVLMHHNLPLRQLKEFSSLRKGQLVSAHFWDETPFGIWKFRIENHQDTSETQISDIYLTLYGTRKDISKHLTHKAACGKVGYAPTKNVNTTLTKVQRTDSVNTFVYVVIGVAVVIVIAVIYCFTLRYGNFQAPRCLSVSTTHDPLITDDEQHMYIENAAQSESSQSEVLELKNDGI